MGNIKILPNLKLVKDWKEGLKFYTTWAWGFVLALPELVEMLGYVAGIDTYGLPEPYSTLLRLIAVAGLLLRFIDQTKPDDDEPIDSPYPGQVEDELE